VKARAPSGGVPFGHTPPRARGGLVHVVVDTPKGSANKYKFDVDLQAFTLSRVLPLGAHFPFDFGFIPGTAAEDGDALDVILIVDVPSFVGCLMKARLIGVVTAEQREQRRTIRNDRLVAVPVTPVNHPKIRRIDDLPTQQLDEFESFFINYNKIQGRRFSPLGRRGPEAAERLLRAGILRAQEETRARSR
jgi:inorganic pyrophosphatase